MWQNASMGITSEWLMAKTGGVASFPGTPTPAQAPAVNELASDAGAPAAPDSAGGAALVSPLADHAHNDLLMV